eukprot:NODE_1821_length_1594_cov_83.384092_g1734_i0.p1 GENE.NODE_1821_length_1594_cov_83.384092_g1734_i0~~NODE_1821_length_1594_cov_83.384092_g1734_i0.p1  ORF type:complete len:442 (-),score=61.23 NODE_1821_length_1594_cov_83.384092_g1734_i0:160-1485(-)
MGGFASNPRQEENPRFVAIEYEYPRDVRNHPWSDGAGKVHPALQESLAAIRKSDCLKSIEVRFEFLLPLDGFSERDHQCCLDGLIEALRCCSGLERLRLIASCRLDSITPLEKDYDCDLALGIALGGLECLPLKHFILEFGQGIPAQLPQAWASLCKMLRRHTFQSFSLGMLSSARQRLPEPPSQVMTTIRELPGLRSVTASAVGQIGGGGRFVTKLLGCFGLPRCPVETVEIVDPEGIDRRSLELPSLQGAYTLEVRGGQALATRNRGWSGPPAQPSGEWGYPSARSTASIRSPPSRAVVDAPVTRTNAVPALGTRSAVPALSEVLNAHDDELPLDLQTGPASTYLGLNFQARKTPKKAKPPTLTAPPPAPTEDGHSSTCVICMEAPRCMLFRPCSHSVCCEDCSRKVKKCPICNQLIRGREVGDFQESYAGTPRNQQVR